MHFIKFWIINVINLVDCTPLTANLFVQDLFHVSSLSTFFVLINIYFTSRKNMYAHDTHKFSLYQSLSMGVSILLSQTCLICKDPLTAQIVRRCSYCTRKCNVSKLNKWVRTGTVTITIYKSTAGTTWVGPEGGWQGVWTPPLKNH